MTWNRADTDHTSTHDSLRIRGKTPIAQPPASEQINLDDPEHLPSVFDAMQVGVNGQGIFGEDQERFPETMERDLMGHGWYPQRSWNVVRRYMFRDTEAV